MSNQDYRISHSVSRQMNKFWLKKLLNKQMTYNAKTICWTLTWKIRLEIRLALIFLVLHVLPFPMNKVREYIFSLHKCYKTVLLALYKLQNLLDKTWQYGWDKPSFLPVNTVKPVLYRHSDGRLSFICGQFSQHCSFHFRIGSHLPCATNCFKI